MSLLGYVNPNDQRVSSYLVVVYLHYSSDTVSVIPRDGNSTTTSQWTHIQFPISYGDSLPDSVDGLIIGLTFKEPSNCQFEAILDNFNFVYIAQGPPVIRFRYDVVDRFGDPDSVVVRPELSYFPKSADFGILPLNNVSYKDTLITFKNTGSDTVRGSVSIIGNGFSVEDTRLLISPMDSVMRKVRFAPPETGKFSGLLVIQTNDPASPDTVFLTGSGDRSTGVSDNPELPREFSLSQNYPNPFNPTTEIRYSVGTYGHTSLRVFDLLGREVAILVNEEKPAGMHRTAWDAVGMPSGVYFYTLQVTPGCDGAVALTGSFTETKKLILMR
jgi:hypothetical protein